MPESRDLHGCVWNVFWGMICSSVLLINRFEQCTGSNHQKFSALCCALFCKAQAQPINFDSRPENSLNVMNIVSVAHVVVPGSIPCGRREKKMPSVGGSHWEALSYKCMRSNGKRLIPKLELGYKGVGCDFTARVLLLPTFTA
eukprot:1160149-Pelagomonas_calceolata.AAC.7